MDVDKCNPTLQKHLKPPELYCKSCNCNVCVKCVSTHKHPVTSIEDIFEEVLKESKDFSQEIRESIQLKVTDKDMNKDKFEKEIQLHYDKQVDAISQYFRELHDQLHFKEVDLKRELKSYHDNNIEHFTTLISKMEHEISESNKFIEKLQTLESNKELATPSSPTLNGSNNNEEKSAFIRNYINQQQYIKNVNDFRYQIYTFKKTDLLTNKLLDSIELFKTSSIASKGKCAIICYSENGVEKYNLTNNQELEREGPLLVKDSPESPSFSGQHNTYYLYQSNSIRDRTYLFFKTKWWLLSHNTTDKDAKTKWKISTNSPIPYSALSTIYDGRDHIYIFGGFDESVNQHVSTIYSFNIHTEKFELVGNLQIAGCVFHLSIYNDKIYILGGYCKPTGAIDRIDEFDINTRTIRNIGKLKELIQKHSYINTGIYIGTTQTFYILDFFKFYKYQQSNSSMTLLGDLSTLFDINKNQVHRSKFYFDGHDTIYLLTTASADLFQYSIIDNTWLKIPFLTNNVTFSYYYSFINQNE
ncbi:hypothetical protein DLAC_07381 [Tieghemostelium lacteum]|uniref:B box-type domain-containing protein n=1 Tax=Tieghemostelium lacteum TaxID=361077 RepID=A0A151ZCD5_TIELA|nr:hypothetical protein DLAC_07381 [Tieghemostelium lacteum]|eukprot:KYQ91612.1 hypothetical protein DLAC_07381 [Tieghemostelium lacteum]